MKILKTAKNGTPVFVIKEKEELNKEEVERAKKIATGREYTRFKSFKISRNKKGELVKIKGKELTEEAKRELKEARAENEVYWNAMKELYKSKTKRRK